MGSVQFKSQLLISLFLSSLTHFKRERKLARMLIVLFYEVRFRIYKGNCISNSTEFGDQNDDSFYFFLL